MAEQDKVNINTPYIGMNLENDPSTFEEGELSFVLNAVMGAGFNDNPHISNSPGTDLDISYPAGFTFLSAAIIDNTRKVVFLVNEIDGLSQIGITDKVTREYKCVVEDAKLGFRATCQIQALVKVSFKGDVWVYWVAANAPMRVMNLSNPPYIRIPNGNGGYTVTTDLDIDQIKLFKNYDLPDIDAVDILNTGKIPSCGLFITMQYADAKGNGLTVWHRMSNKIPIIRDSISDAYENITGCKSNIPTNKAVRIKISGADPSFTHINIGVIRVIDGAQTGFRVSTISVAQEEYIYTGATQEIPVPMDVMIQPAVVYDSALTIGESDGSLVLGNLTSKKKLNLQPYISNIQVQWQALRTKKKDRLNSHKNPLFAAYKQSARRDEVIPLGIVLEFQDGTESEAHPFIGRALNTKSDGTAFTIVEDRFGNFIPASQWDDKVWPVNDDVYENTTLPRWQVYNTATIEGDKATGPDKDGLSYYGECSYWESTDRYPDNKAVWGELAGKPMRFPKTPDVGLLPLVKDGFVYHLGFTFPNIEQVLNSLPDDYKAQIKGWRIVRADRTSNKSVLASGILYNCFEQEFRSTPDQLSDKRLYPNYPLNDLRPDRYIQQRVGLSAADEARNVILGGGQFTGNSKYRKDTFTFLSPDTTLKREVLTNSELKIEGELTGTADCFHTWVSPFPLLSADGGTDDNRKAAIQGIAIGDYSGRFIPSAPGNHRRKLKEAMYIPGNAFVSGGNAGESVWNKTRESTVLLSVEKDIVDPVTQDRTRFKIDNSDAPPEGEKFKATGATNNVEVHTTRPTSAHYGTVKMNIPNQYGSIFNIRWVETGYTKNRYLAEGACFGGDTYIGLFASKRQMSFYNTLQDWMTMPDGADGMDLKAFMSIPGVMNYYRNTGGSPKGISFMIKAGAIASLDLFSFCGDLGYICLFMHGVPMFYAESDVNMELRYEGDLDWEAAYPSLHDGGTPLQEWLGVKNLDKDNAFYNNIDLSGYNDLTYIANTDPLYEPDNNDVSHYSTRAVKSLRSQPEDLYDNWQVFKPLDYYDFPKSRGALRDIRYVGQARTLFRFERTLFYTSLQQSIASSEGQILLGTGRLFAQDPQELIFTDLGYGGTGSQWAFNMTPFGAFMADADNGKVFNFAGGMQEISNNKAASWFRQNLPFKLSRDIKSMPTDNPANPNGIGLLSAWDPKHNLWILTKKDYELLDKSQASAMTYDDGIIRLSGTRVELKDESIFINRSWSIAFSPITKRWFTFYSFIPDYYIPDNDTVVSVVASDQYTHDGQKMHTFYGKYAPFIVETVNKMDGLTEYVSAHTSFIANSYKVTDGGLVPVRNRSFNKAIVSGAHQCSGVLNLVVQDENNLYMMYKGLKVYSDCKDVALRYRHNAWHFSDYFDIVKEEGFFTLSWNYDKFRAAYPIDKVINDSKLDYRYPWKQGAMIRGIWTKTRLILDNADDLKLLMQIGIEGARVSY